MSLDLSTVAVLLGTAALIGVLAGVLAPWRRLVEGADLPVRRFAPQLLGPVALEGALRCALCAERARCAQRAAPPADCPNVGLFRRGA